jgi:hypothetical protein
MNHGFEHVKEQALKGAVIRLRSASTFVRLNTKSPLFQKRMGKGNEAVLVRLEWPGVLSVIDPETGELLAVSEPGQPGDLRKGFVPPVPALAGVESGGTSQGAI